jgi:hypothetical protein
MMGITESILAGFTIPLRIGITSLSNLWLLPLVVAICVVYKTTKMQEIKTWPFLKEIALLFGSIIVFMMVTAIVIAVLAWMITE